MKRSACVRLSFVFILACFFFIPDLQALDPERKLTDYLQTNFNSTNGLPEDSVLSIVQSPDGYLWFGGYYGISRFDGVQFVPFNQLSATHVAIRTVGFLFFDSRGLFWFGTFSGLYSFDGKILRKFGEKEGTPDALFYHATEDSSGAVWIASGKGLLKWDGSRFTKFDDSSGLPSPYVHAVYADPDGSIWAGTQDGLAVIKNGRVIRHYSQKDGLANNAVWAILRDQSGAYWIGTEGGISKLENNKFTNYNQHHGLANNVVNTLRLDSRGALWAGTEAGLTRLYKGKIESIGSKDGLAKDSIWQIHEDSEQNLWIGMSYGGVTRLTESRVQVIGKKEGLSTDTVTTILESRKGTLWIGTDEGLNRIENGKISLLTTSEGLLSNYISSLHEDSQGNLWIGTRGGLNRLIHEKIESYTTANGLTDPVVLAITEDDSGSIWIGTLLGAHEWRDGRIIPHPELGRGTIMFISPAKGGGVWLVTLAGVIHFKNGQMKKVPMEGEIQPSCLYQDAEASLWIGTTTAGLWRYKNDKWKNFGATDGLGTAGVGSILEDNYENLWLGTNNGILRVSKSELSNFAEDKISRIQSFHLDTTDGMRKAECYDLQQPVAWKSQDGRMWFATLGGAAVVDPKRIKLNLHVPTCRIERMILDGKDIDINRPQILPAGSKNFEFHFTAFSFAAPERVQFRYQLAGFDRDWIDSATRRQVQYTNIPPGRYIFRIQASNNDGIWNEKGAAFQFKIRPYFYQTPWFYVACAGLFAFGIWRIHLYRMNRALEIERIRTHIATDLHDDIGAGLTQIAVLSEVLRAQSNSNPQEPLETIANSSRELIDSMSDIVWSVDPDKDRINDLLLRMRRFATDVLGSKSIRFHFDTSGLQENQVLEPFQRRNLYLVFKEAINNLFRHSGCTDAEITLHAENNSLIMKIKDNGKGYDPSNVHSDGHGIRSMKNRAREVGGVLTIETNPGNGTMIALSIPLKK